MTDSRPESPTPEREPFVTIPVSLIRYVRQRKLSGLQYELWLYFYEHDPYGQRWVDIPSPEEIAIALECDPRSIYRAAQKLQDYGLFDFEIKSWKARNTTAVKSSPQNSPDSGIKLSGTGSNCPELDQIVKRSTI